jgi:Zn-dependent protease with chaperone function
MNETLTQRAFEFCDYVYSLLRLSLLSVRVAVRRQPWACAAGLLCGWTALFAALWFAALFAVGGAIGGFIGLGFLTLGIGQGSEAFALAGAVTGFAAGFVAGFLAIFGGSVSSAPLHVVASLVIGAISAWFLTFISVAFEGIFLDFRQYRRPSLRAEEGALKPLLAQVGAKMGLPAVPILRIHDSPVPGTWTHTRTIVLTKGLVSQLDEDEMAGAMAHDLHHWISRDALCERFVWACTFPLVVLVNFYTYIVMGVRSLQWLAPFIFVLIWPAFTLLRFVVTPLMRARGRRLEYEADAAAIAAGYGAGLAGALAKTSEFEVARTGWEEALLRTHPPTEFRLEAIEVALAQPAPRRTSTALAGRPVAPRRNARLQGN